MDIRELLEFEEKAAYTYAIPSALARLWEFETSVIKQTEYKLTHATQQCERVHRLIT